MKLTENILSTKYYFNNKENYILEDHIYIDNKPVMNTKDIIIKGTHNYENILVTYLLAKVLDIDFLYVNEVLKEFKGVEHRIEFVRELNGVKYYNDSIGTSPASTMAGLNAFDENIILLAGGSDKGLDYKEIGETIARKVGTLILTGPTSEKIENATRIALDEMNEGKDKRDIEIIHTSNLEESVKMAKISAKPGDIVLLSPASASFDAFKNFMERGQKFKDFVNELK